MLDHINASSHRDNYVLKGGTGLLFCHGLDRFSEDIDLDGIRPVRLEKCIEAACNESGLPCTVRIAKDTDTVLKYMIDFQEAEESMRHPLKIECSFRNSNLLKDGVYIPEDINGIRTYSLKTLVAMKFSAFRSRHAIRDFYDVCWFVANRPEVVDPQLAAGLWETLQYKDFDALVEELQETAQEDHLMSETNVEDLAIKMLEQLPELMKGL